MIIFAMDRDRWYPVSRFLRTAVTGRNGTFTLTGLPFGNYYAAAVAHPPGDSADAWQERLFLEALVSRASSLMLGDRQKLTLNLRVKPATCCRRGALGPRGELPREAHPVVCVVARA